MYPKLAHVAHDVGGCSSANNMVMAKTMKYINMVLVLLTQCGSFCGIRRGEFVMNDLNRVDEAGKHRLRFRVCGEQAERKPRESQTSQHRHGESNISHHGLVQTQGNMLAGMQTRYKRITKGLAALSWSIL